MSAELNIQLRLLQDQVAADAKSAGAKAATVMSTEFEKVNKKLGGTMGGGFSDEFKKLNPHLFVAQKQMAAITESANKFKNVLWQSKSMLQGQFPAMPSWLKNLPSGILIGAQQSSHVDFFRAMQRDQRDKQRFGMDMSSLALPFFNPLSPWSTLWGTKNIFKGMTTEHGAAFREKYMGGMGAGAATGLLVAGATAAGLALKGFAKVVQETMAAYERARFLYAKSTTSGFGLGAESRRTVLSSVIGIGDQDLLRFGAAIDYLSKKVEWSSSIMEKTAIPLTQVSWEFKLLGENTKAIFNQIAAAVAPAFGAFAEDLNSFLEVLGKSEFLKGAGEVFNVVLVALNDVIGLIEIAVNGFTTGFRIIADVLSIFIMDTLNLLSHIPGLKKLGGWDTSVAKKDIVDQSTNLLNEANLVAKNFFGKSSKDMPAPQAFMKQLPASTWEKMGLVIGGGGGTNYQQHIAKNTAETNKLLSRLLGQEKNHMKSPIQALPALP
jgi:hypothetical protein